MSRLTSSEELLLVAAQLFGAAPVFERRRSRVDTSASTNHRMQKSDATPPYRLIIDALSNEGDRVRYLK